MLGLVSTAVLPGLVGLGHLLVNRGLNLVMNSIDLLPLGPCDIFLFNIEGLVYTYNLINDILIGVLHLEDELYHVVLGQVIGHVTVLIKGYRLVLEVCQ